MEIILHKYLIRGRLFHQEELLLKQHNNSNNSNSFLHRIINIIQLGFKILSQINIISLRKSNFNSINNSQMTLIIYLFEEAQQKVQRLEMGLLIMVKIQYKKAKITITTTITCVYRRYILGRIQATVSLIRLRTFRFTFLIIILRILQVNGTISLKQRHSKGH